MAAQISVETLSPITHNQTPVITTELLARLYGTETNNIKVNFTRNAERFVEGKHYFKLEGPELRDFKNKVTQSNLVAPRTKHLILWSERGAARHAKMLETDQAWEVFEKLEDCYFNQKCRPAVTDPSAIYTLTLTEDELCSLCWLWKVADNMRKGAEMLYPGLKQLSSQYSGQCHDMAFESRYTLKNVKEILRRETMNIDSVAYRWRFIIPQIRQIN